MTASLKKQQKIISGLSETVKNLGYDIREVRDGVARSSNAGSGTGNIFELWEEIDELFKKKFVVIKIRGYFYI